MATEESSAIQKPEEAVVELPAPPGWKKTYNPGKSGTPKRYQVVFTSPSGEEIKTKSQLDKYLKSHPGGPAAYEFDWSTGETPRRSSRISSKAKETESPEDEPPSKRSRSKKAAKAEASKTDDEDKDAEEEEVSEAAKEIKSSEDAKMQDLENVKQMEKGDISSGELMEGTVPTSEENVEGISPMKKQEPTLAGGGPMSEEKVEVNTEVVEQHGDAFKEYIPAGKGSMSEEKLEVNTEVVEQHGDAFKEYIPAGKGSMSEEKVEVNTEVVEQHGDAFKEYIPAGKGSMSEEKVEVNTEVEEQHGDAFKEYILAGKGSMSEEKVEVNTKVVEQHGDAFKEYIPAGQGSMSEEKFEVNTEVMEQHGDAFKEYILAGEGLMSEKVEVSPGVWEQHGDAFKESTLEEEQKSTLAGDAPLARETLKTEIPEQHGFAFEDFSLGKEQISVSSLKVPETNASKGADINPQGPENFQEAETFSEANIGGTINETIQIVGGSVKGARNCLAESKAPVPEDVIDMEKSSHKGGEVETNPSVEEAWLRNQTM